MRKPTRARRGGVAGFEGRRYSYVLLMMLYGSTVAALVVLAGIASLMTEGIKPRSPLNAAGQTSRAAANPSAADLSITARNLGNLRVSLRVRVTMNESRAALEQARPRAYLDMVQMPGAHSEGPIDLLPTDRPGVYSAVAKVSMLGDYEVRVVLNEPVRAEATKIVPVGVTS